MFPSPFLGHFCSHSFTSHFRSSSPSPCRPQNIVSHFFMALYHVGDLVVCQKRGGWDVIMLSIPHKEFLISLRQPKSLLCSCGWWGFLCCLAEAISMVSPVPHALGQIVSAVCLGLNFDSHVISLVYLRSCHTLGCHGVV